MGDSVNQTPLHGIATQDERWLIENLTEKDDATVLLRSSYTQASPIAGPAVPAVPAGADYDMGLKTYSGSNIVPQDAELRVITGRAGHPIPRGYNGGGGAGFVYRNYLEPNPATPNYRGWDHFSSISDWLTVQATTNAVNEFDCTVLRLNNYQAKRGHLLTIAEKNGNDPLCMRYDPDTNVWTDLGSIGLILASDIQYSLVELPTGRVLLFYTDLDLIQVDVLASDDGGATWGEYASDVLSTPFTDSGDNDVAAERISAAYSNGEILLFLSYTDTGHGNDRNLAQYSSIDKGATFTLIKGDFWADDEIYPADVPTVSASRDSGFVVTVYDYDELNDDYTPAIYRLGTSVAPLDQATPLHIADYGSGVVWDTPAVRALAHFFDEDWNLYVVHLRYDASPGKYKLHVYRSIDLGATAETHAMDTWDSVDDLEYLYKFDCAATGGKAFLVTRFETDSATSYDGPSVMSLCLGAMSAHTLPVSDLLAATSGENPNIERNQLGWAPDVAETGDATSYIPTSFPLEQGWTTAGAGSESLNTNGELVVAPGGGVREYTKTFTNTAIDKFIGEWIVRVPTGGDKTTSNHSINIVHRTAGGFECEVEIRLEDDGYIVRDMIAPADKVTVSIDLTVATHIRVAIEDAADTFKVSVWDCPASHAHDYVIKLGNTSVNNRITTTATRIKFGARAANADNSNWKFSAGSTMPDHWTDRAPDYLNDWGIPEALHTRTYSTTPMLVDDGIYIAATAGPTRIDEYFTIKADYDYPLWALDPTRSKRPSRTWRTVDTSSLVALVFDLEDQYNSAYMDNSALAFFFLGANFETFTVEGWTGAAWTTLATATASTGYGSLAYTREGRKVRPNWSASTSGVRYLYNEDHIGDTFNLGSAEGTQYVKITSNREGAWDGDGTGFPDTKTPTVTLDNDQLVGTEPASGASGEIWRKDFGVVIKGYNGTYDRFRIVIPVQSTADGYFEAGQLIAGDITFLAKQYDRGWIFRHMYPIDIRELPDGSTTNRKTGLMRRQITFSWNDTLVDLCPTNVDNPSPNYRTAEIGLGYPVGTMHDTTRVMEGIIRRAFGSTKPVLLLTAIDQDTTAGATTKVQQVNIRRTFVYGEVISEPSVTAERGTEAATELETMAPITIRELV